MSATLATSQSTAHWKSDWWCGHCLTAQWNTNSKQTKTYWSVGHWISRPTTHFPECSQLSYNLWTLNLSHWPNALLSHCLRSKEWQSLTSFNQLSALTPELLFIAHFGQIHFNSIYFEQFGLWGQSVLSIYWPECRWPAEQPEGVEFGRWWPEEAPNITMTSPASAFNVSPTSGSIGLHLEKGLLAFVALSPSQSSNLWFPPKFLKGSVWLRKAKLWLSMVR